MTNESNEIALGPRAAMEIARFMESRSGVGDASGSQSTKSSRSPKGIDKKITKHNIPMHTLDLSGTPPFTTIPLYSPNVRAAISLMKLMK
jgi:hypothetical protein